MTAFPIGWHAAMMRAATDRTPDQPDDPTTRREET
jgi:hypothetical protein